MQTYDYVNNKFLQLITNITSDDCHNLRDLAENWHDTERYSDPDELALGIMVAGLINKFERPDKLLHEQRHKQAIFDYLKDDLMLANTKANMKLPKDMWTVTCGARNWIKDTLRGVQFDYADCWFGPGECYDSHKGKTSAVSKLFKLPYTVTSGARDDAIQMLWSNRQLRRWLCSGLDLANKNAGQTELLIAAWFRDNLEIVKGNRLTSVPKNNQKNRDIGIEPKLNLMLQKGIGKLIRRALKRNREWDLDYGQDYHAHVIASDSKATIDLSSASNLVSLELVRRFVPGWLYDRITRYRSTHACVEYDNRLYAFKLRKVSSMGNGFTFELLTLILMSIARQYDPDATVYGDDIVIDRNAAQDFMNYLESCTDLRINHAKSFTDGKVRESCGAFFVEDREITRYDFRWCRNINDAVLLTNKLGKLLQSFDKRRYRGLYIDLAETHHAFENALQRAEIPYGPETKDLTDMWLYANEQNTDLIKSTIPTYRKGRKALDKLRKDLQYDNKTSYCLEVKVFDPTRGKRFKHRVVTQCNRKDLRAYTVLLHENMLPTVYLRGDGEWIIRYVVIDTRGNILKFL